MLEDKKDKIYRSVLVWGLPLLILVTNWCLNKPCFETNDDYNIMAILSGGITGKPEALETYFCNYLWSFVVSSLYRITAIVPWYTIIELIIIYTSLVVVFDFCLRTLNEKVVYGLIVFIWLYICLFCWYATILQYTVVPAFAGMAATLLIIKEKDSSQNDKWKIARFVCFLLFALAAIIMRAEIGYVFVLATFIYSLTLYIFYGFKSTKRYVISATIIQIITYIANRLFLRIDSWSDFAIYSLARSKWIDYPSLEYADNPKVYEAVGWSSEFYELARNWFFLDENFTTESLNKINANYNPTNNYSVIEAVKWILKTGPLNFHITVLAIIALTVYVAIISKRKKEIIIIGGFVAGTISILLYLTYSGRLMYRVLYAIVLIFILPACCLCFSETKMREGIWKYQIIRHDTAIVGSIILLFSILCEEGIYRGMSNYSAGVESQNKVVASMNEYAYDHPEKFYVYDTTLAWSGSVFTTFKPGKSSNLRFWGGGKHTLQLIKNS